VHVDGIGANLGAAANDRPDVGKVFPSFGSAHGFDTVLSAAPGQHNVCAFGINVNQGGNVLLGCRTVIVNPSPIGNVVVARPASADGTAGATAIRGIEVSGWAIDPDTSAPIEVHVYTDAGGVNIGPASADRPDVGAYFATQGYGSDHGFHAFIPASPGWHPVCVFGINIASGANTMLACIGVTVA